MGRHRHAQKVAGGADASVGVGHDEHDGVTVAEASRRTGRHRDPRGADGGINRVGDDRDARGRRRERRPRDEACSRYEKVSGHARYDAPERGADDSWRRRDGEEPRARRLRDRSTVGICDRQVDLLSRRRSGAVRGDVHRQGLRGVIDARGAKRDAGCRSRHGGAGLDAAHREDHRVGGAIVRDRRHRGARDGGHGRGAQQVAEGADTAVGIGDHEGDALARRGGGGIRGDVHRHGLRRGVDARGAERDAGCRGRHGGTGLDAAHREDHRVGGAIVRDRRHRSACDGGHGRDGEERGGRI